MIMPHTYSSVDATMWLWFVCRPMGSLIQRVVFNSEKTHTTTYESDGSRLGGWTILNGPAQKTARLHHFLVENEYVFNV